MRYLRTLVSFRTPAILVRAICLLSLVLVLIPQVTLAQPPPIDRILVLHGIWNADVFQLRFDTALAENLASISDIEISTQYLGLNMEVSEEGFLRLRNFIETTIRERNVDLVLALLPGAIDFLLSLDLPEQLPIILVLPDTQSTLLASAENNIAVISSSAPSAIRNTLQHIQQLKPDLATIEVIVGSDFNDQSYLSMFREALADIGAFAAVNYHIGVNPEALIQTLAGLEDTSVVFNLPYNSFTQEDGLLGDVSHLDFIRVVQASSVPVFSFYENANDAGITGGFMSSIDDYASSAAAQIRSQRANGSWLQLAPPDIGGAFYDWQLAQRWDLDLSLIEGEIELANRPASLWETNRALAMSIVFVVVILLLVQVFMSVLLRRSQIARSRIEESERHARESESKFRLLAMNTIDMIWTWNFAENTIGYCSPAVKRITGFSPDEFVGRAPSELIAPDSLELCKQMHKRSQHEGEVVELQHYTKDGNTIWCEMTAQPMSGQEKNDTWVVVTRDISQRKAFESEREAMESVIRQSQKFESLGTLAGGIAHDFNNILTVIVGVTEMLRTEISENAKAKSLVTKLEHSAHRATSLVRQILTFSKQSQGNRSSVALQELVDGTLEIIRAGVTENISIEFLVLDAELLVLTDQSQIEQVILNLVTNAVQAIDGPRGEIKISLSKCSINSSRKFAHGGELTGEFALLEIQDNGCGIPNSQMEKIFDPFYTSKELGNGMGLAIVRGVVLKHGGAVEVQSEVGAGTKFCIYLPLAKHLPVKVLEQATVAGEIKSLRILIIDDQKELLDVVSRMVGSLGHKPVTSSSPRDALKILENEHGNIDLVITDYSMPEIDGLEIVRICTKHYPEIPIILCSGFGEQLPDQAQQIAGATIRILEKPFGLKSIRDVLQECFNNQIGVT